MSVNKCILVGRLGAEPESRAFPNGGSICNLRLATTENWKDKQTGERRERTEWHRITLSNHLGNIAQKYLHKGAQVYIEGRIQTRKWQDQSGNDRYSTEIVGDSMTMLDTKPAESSAASQQAQVNKQYGEPQPAAQQASSNYADGKNGDNYPIDDDIPF